MENKNDIANNTEPADGMEKDKDYVVGYMCGVDWQHEIGCAADGNRIFPSENACVREKKCTDECGIVEVRVYFNRWVKRQTI